VHERGPLMVAFRSLHTDDSHLRGTALEFLEGILPVKTREMLWEIIQERPPASTPRNPGEVLEDLLKASPTIVLLLKEVPPPDENVV